MANNSDTSSDERAQHIAELKRKMQESAKKAKAAQAAKEAAAEAAAPSEAEVVDDAVTEEVSVDESAAADPTPVAEAVSEELIAEASDAEAAPVVEVAAPAAVAEVFPSNDDHVVAESAVTASVFKNPDEITPEMAAKKQMNRREFLTYAWGAALGLAVLQVGAVSFFFMYPRFKAGEFGGAFFMGPESALPPPDAAPIGVPDGKFWWLTVEDDSPHAIFMVCTHLGCLYKWVGETNRFECPCHGSKFTREGLYIEGPAPRSLDEFEVALVDGEYIVDTGAKIIGAPASESEAAAEA